MSVSNFHKHHNYRILQNETNGKFYIQKKQRMKWFFICKKKQPIKCETLELAKLKVKQLEKEDNIKKVTIQGSSFIVHYL